MDKNCFLVGTIIATGAPLRTTSSSSPPATRLRTSEKLRATSVAVSLIGKVYQINRIEDRRGVTPAASWLCGDRPGFCLSSVALDEGPPAVTRFRALPNPGTVWDRTDARSTRQVRIISGRTMTWLLCDGMRSAGRARGSEPESQPRSHRFRAAPESRSPGQDEQGGFPEGSSYC